MEAHALRAGEHGRRVLPPRLRRIASDERLVGLVRAGDAGAFEALFDRYRGPILSFCRHMLGSAEEAEDAVQHVFLSAYNGIVADDRPLHLRAWLYTIARNQSLSQLRARREQASLEDFEPSVDGLASQVQQRADLRDMLRDVARLPDDQRAALVLAELGDLSHDDIAEVVGCPKGKVKALVFQARSSLAASRDARDTSCADIREQLSTLTGGSLRRTTLRRHLRECEGCRAFGDEVKRQRAAMAILLPVVPTAGLKSGVLSAVGLAQAAGGAAVGTGAAAGGGLAAVAGSGAVKLAVAAAIAAGGVGGGVAAVQAVEDGSRPVAPSSVLPEPNSSSQTAREILLNNPASGVVPTRAGGAHAPGRQTGGVANGAQPKGERGRSRTAPGRAGTSPGRAGTSPGRSGATPGRSGTAPRRTRSAPPQGRTRSESAPGRTQAPALTAPRAPYSDTTTGTGTRGDTGRAPSTDLSSVTRGSSPPTRLAPDLRRALPRQAE
ncbi:MAG TPA: sigma-70 family RNA polymerase sigma factor [Solirubrobacteraceae bacterium]|nr:sigma-70 family RNA polymerase sigma factor [Solirubrobacteraceae bacterium]